MHCGDLKLWLTRAVAKICNWELNLADHKLNTVFGHSCVSRKFGMICKRQSVDFPDDFCPTCCLSSIISRSADGTGYGVYVPGVRQVRYRLHEPSSVFTA
jgi:hypothetical protein